jgi:predicted dehydrogenase
MESVATMTTTNRVLLAGVGVRGRQWAAAIERSQLTTLAGSVDVDPAAGGVGGAPFHTSLERAIVETRPDLVVLATPPLVHAEQAKTALDRGIPVLCEKPLCETAPEAADLARYARDRGTMLLVGMNFRYLPVSRRLRRVVAEGSLGGPMFSLFKYIRNRDGRRPDLNSFPLDMDQPMLYEQSVHHLDVMRYVFGREIQSVQARTWNPATSVYRDDSCVAAILEFDGGLIVNYLGTWTSGTNRFAFDWRIDFEGGVATQSEQFDHLGVARMDPSTAITGPLFNAAAEPLRRVPLAAVSPFQTETLDLLEHAVRAARGEEPPGPTAADHLRTLLALDAIVESSRTGKRVSLADVVRARGLADVVDGADDLSKPIQASSPEPAS